MLYKIKNESFTCNKGFEKKSFRIFFVALLAITMHASSQKTAFTFSIFNTAYYVNTSPFTQGYMGIGIERNVGDYISLKLEVNQGFMLFYRASEGNIITYLGDKSVYTKDWIDSSGQSHSFPYHWSVPALDINYQSKFFFYGNDRGGVYMAMGIGVRSVKYTLHVGSTDDYVTYVGEIPKELEAKDDYSENLVIVPLIMRIGLRGYMRGFFPDLSFGVGYNMAHDKTIEDRTITKTWGLEVPKLSGLTVTGSISFGIGW